MVSFGFILKKNWVWFNVFLTLRSRLKNIVLLKYYLVLSIKMEKVYKAQAIYFCFWKLFQNVILPVNLIKKKRNAFYFKRDCIDHRHTISPIF